MWKSAAAMLAGVSAILVSPELPPFPLLLSLAVPIVGAALYWRRLRWLILLPCGAAWCWLAADAHLATRLDPALESRDLTLVGWVSSLPEEKGGLSEFQFDVETLGGRPPGKGIPRKVRLSMEDGARLPQAGEHWDLKVRLRSPRGFMDPGAFDYEGWLFFHGIGATGYVTHADARLQGTRYPLLRMRAELRARLQTALAGDPFAGMAVALVTGDQGEISQDQWQVLQATNTVHLMAIAGLHIGVVAGFLFLLTRLLWRRSAWASMRVPASVAAAVSSFMGAVFYAALAGFTLPTQRALIMLAAFTLGVLLRRRLGPPDTLALAMLGVLVWDPLAPGEASFWLSFAAVAAILFVFSARVNQRHNWFYDLLRTQWAVGVGLLPLLAFFFQQAGISSPLANLVAVPVYALCVVPVVLVGSVLLYLWPWAGAAVLKLGTLVMSWTWPALQMLGASPSLTLHAPSVSWYIAAVASMGAVWIIMPRAMPGRFPSVLLLLPLFVMPASGLAAGDFDLRLLDVGQGLAAVVRTAGHTLIFDTGPRFRSGSDTGQEVLLPYLRSQGISVPDLIMVSHGDADHAGGLASLRQAFPGVPVLTGDMRRVPDAQPCLRGRDWDWEGVRFEVLSPDVGDPLTGNDGSCVLRVSGPGGSLLLPGDLMKKGEARLLAMDAGGLRSDVLVAPHHGSNSSSTAAFVTAVAPIQVLFPVGYRNRWGFPKPEVEARYLASAGLADTAADGALLVQFRAGRRPVIVSRWREDAARLWTARGPVSTE
ncbi:MAG TPA: DNA internalization-related competence protein ComEC/Rec2 [Gammaproteobacteria bacterium]|nr:DNA internalization-related competence protein ComEC/Rec2 [Gammaproteobacteria bacterium]